MEYLKIINLLDNTSYKPCEFRKKIGLKSMINQEEHITIIVKSNLKSQC